MATGRETKPFSAISKSMRFGKYKVFGAYLDSVFASYAFIYISRNGGKTIALLDYFAVVEGMRGNGLGREIFKNLSPDQMDFEYVLVESESISDSANKEDSDIRQKRIHFYEFTMVS